MLKSCRTAGADTATRSDTPPQSLLILCQPAGNTQRHVSKKGAICQDFNEAKGKLGLQKETQAANGEPTAIADTYTRSVGGSFKV